MTRTLPSLYSPYPGKRTGSSIQKWIGTLGMLSIGFLCVAISHSAEAADTAAGIDQFLGLSWGSDTAAVRARMGAPSYVSRLGDGGRVYAYTEENGEEDPEAREQGPEVERTRLFYIHSSHGLLRGMVKVEFPADRPCLDPFQRWRSRLERTYAGLPTREDKINPPPGVPFCEALSRGQARWAVRWEDDRGRYVILSLEAEGITVNVTTPAFTSWLKGT